MADNCNKIGGGTVKLTETGDYPTLDTVDKQIIGGINENAGRIDFLEGIGAFTTKSDPAVDAITQADIDNFLGCVIILTAPGNDQTLPTPTAVSRFHQFIIINDDVSTDPIDIIGSSTKILLPGEFIKFVWDGSAWVALSGGSVIWIDDGTDIKAAFSTRNLDLQTGLLKLDGTGVLSKSGDIITIAGLTIDISGGATDRKVSLMSVTEQDDNSVIKQIKFLKWTDDGLDGGTQRGYITFTSDALGQCHITDAAGDTMAIFQSTKIQFKPDTESTSSATGGAIAFGGMGIAKNLNIGGDFGAVGDIKTVAWADYGGTSTIVGFSSITTKAIWYKKVGNLVFVNFNIIGASNASNFTFTLPFTAANSAFFNAVSAVRVQNNTVNQTDPGGLSLPGNSNIATVNRNLAFFTWASGGTKSATGQFWYEAG